MDEPLMSRQVSQRFPAEVSQDIDLELNVRDYVVSPECQQEAKCCSFKDMIWALLIGIAEAMGFIGTLVPVYLLILDWTAHYMNGSKSALMLELLVPYTAVHLLRTQIAILRSSFIRWIALVFVFLYVFLPWSVLNEPIVTVPAGLILFVLVVPPPLKFIMDQGLYACFPCPALLAGWGIATYLLYEQWEAHGRNPYQLFSTPVAIATTFGILLLYFVTPIQFLVIVTLGHTNLEHTL